MPDEPSLELPSLFRRKRPLVEQGTPPAVEKAVPPPVQEAAPPVVEEGALAPVTKPPRRPLAPLPAAFLIGVLVGLVTAGLVWAALRGCSSLRGTSSCGDPGLLVLLAIFVVMVIGARVLLGALRVPDAASTAFLGMALLAVLALLFVGDLDNALAATVLAVVGGATFGLSQWVTSTFTEPGDRPR